MTYECTICLNVNHVSRLHCQTCGAIPKMYSIIGETACEHSQRSDGCSINYYIPFVVAHGADRAEHHRTMRTYLRTVPADYYGSSL